MALVEKAILEDDLDRYSLIMTDCSMPFMDGYEASKKIRALIRLAKAQSESQLKIIAITGHVETAYLKKATEHGIDQVFPKPMPILELGNILVECRFISEIPKSLLVREQE